MRDGHALLFVPNHPTQAVEQTDSIVYEGNFFTARAIFYALRNKKPFNEALRAPTDNKIQYGNTNN